MFSTADWELDVPASNISFAKKIKYKKSIPVRVPNIVNKTILSDVKPNKSWSVLKLVNNDSNSVVEKKERKKASKGMQPAISEIGQFVRCPTSPTDNIEVNKITTTKKKKFKQNNVGPKQNGKLLPEENFTNTCKAQISIHKSKRKLVTAIDESNDKKSKKKKSNTEELNLNTDELDKLQLNIKNKKNKCDLKKDDKEVCNLFMSSKKFANTAGTRKPTLNSSCSETKTKADLRKERLKKVLDLVSHRSPIKTTSSLREKMMEKLKAAQFRYLNEKLYTSSGAEAQQLFQTDPSAFSTYHEGYQLQLKKWPVNPLDIIVKKISKMPKAAIVADMGCGEATLSKRVAQTVRSFDLVAKAPGVEACDMAHTPLLSASIDVAVYCLALMGTELTQYLVEANRILKLGGLLLIAEVESRFDDADQFAKDVERLGFKLLKLDKSNKVFFFLEFKKIQETGKKAKRPVLSLKPCLYKRR